MRRAVLVIALLVATPVFAQPADPRTVATRLTEEGIAAYQRKEYATALARFQQAFAKFPAAKLHYNLGLSLAGLGRDLEAAVEYELFLAEAGDAPADNRTFVEKELVRIDGVVGRLAITIDPAAGTVTVDGKALLSRSEPLRVSPGDHLVVAEAAGYRRGERRVTAVAGQLTAVTIYLEPLPAVVPGKEPGGSVLRQWWFWGTVGAVAIVTTATIVVLSRSGGLPDGELEPIDVRGH